MEHFKDEYERRKEEICQYLTLLETLDNDGAQIVSLDDSEGKELPSGSLQVLKASFYLVLYNLAEATINAGVQSIYNRISDEGLDFKDIIEQIQKVWWLQHHEKLASCSRNQLIDNIFGLFKESIYSFSPLKFNNFVSGISGNVDAEGVRRVCRDYGVALVNDGRDLESVKRYRNWLSHGNKSFSEVGKDVVISDLLIVRNNTFTFMDEFVQNIMDYLDSRNYSRTG